MFHTDGDCVACQPLLFPTVTYSRQCSILPVKYARVHVQSRPVHAITYGIFLQRYFNKSVHVIVSSSCRVRF